MSEPTIFRLATANGHTVQRRYGGAALYESVKAARSARSQMSWGSDLRIQELVAEPTCDRASPLAWETVTE